MSIAPTEAPVATLTHADRCDRCGARAYVLVLLKWSPGLPSAGELYMCAHDYKINAEAMAPYVSMTIDERFQLTEHIKDDKGVR
jgi:hypothetical protein